MGRASAIIDTNVDDAMAWYFAFCGRGRSAISQNERHPVRIIVREYTPHDHLFATVKKMPFPFRLREVVFRMICASNEEGQRLIAFEGCDDPVDYGKSFNSVRAMTNGLLRLEPLPVHDGIPQCKVTLIQLTDIGWHIPVREEARASCSDTMARARCTDALLLTHSPLLLLLLL